MMYVKANTGGGHWDLYEAERISFLGQGSAIEVPDADHAYSEDDRFPNGWEYLHLLRVHEPLRAPRQDDGDIPPPFRLVRYVRWFDPRADECHLLVTDGPVFIMNAEGRTIEAMGVQR